MVMTSAFQADSTGSIPVRCSNLAEVMELVDLLALEASALCVWVRVPPSVLPYKKSQRGKRHERNQMHELPNAI